MPKCVNFTDIDEVVTCAEMDNVPGTSATVEIGLADEVESWPDFPAADGEAMSLAEAGTISGNLVLAKGASRCKLTFTRNTGEFTMTDQGEPGSENVLYALTLERAKMSAEIFGFLNATRGRRLWIKVTDKNGQTYLMGDKTNQAYRVAGDSATTGKATSDANRVPMRFEYVCPRNLVFAGEIQELSE